MTLERLWAGWRMPYVSGTPSGGAPTAESEPESVPATSQSGVLRDGGATEEAGSSPGPAGRSDPSCVFCGIFGSGIADDRTYVVWRGSFTAAVCNAYPYAPGHVMVLPLRHISDLSELSADESSELWDATREAVAALRRAYRPGGVNMGANLGSAAGAGVPGHLHIHAVPRWHGDTNFMTAIAEARVLPESLSDSWARLRAAWGVGEVQSS